MFNKVILAGNLTRDVELRYLPSGAALAKLGLAVNRRFKKQDGSQGDEVCYIDVNLFGRTAEVANQYLKKALQCLLKGVWYWKAGQIIPDKSEANTALQPKICKCLAQEMKVGIMEMAVEMEAMGATKIKMTIMVKPLTTTTMGILKIHNKLAHQNHKKPKKTKSL